MDGNGMVNKVFKGIRAKAQPLSGMTLVELAGDRRVLIENHKGVTAYGKETICLRTSFGQISVVGSGMELVQMSRCQLVITGKIHEISINGGA